MCSRAQKPSALMRAVMQQPPQVHKHNALIALVLLRRDVMQLRTVPAASLLHAQTGPSSPGSCNAQLRVRSVL